MTIGDFATGTRTTPVSFHEFVGTFSGAYSASFQGSFGPGPTSSFWRGDFARGQRNQT